MTKEIPLTQGKVALVDDADLLWLSRWKWCAQKQRDGERWYAVTHVPNPNPGPRQKRLLMHRLILRAASGVEIDHEDGDGLNNQRNNIRVATHAENMRNRRRWANKHGFKGVYKNSKSKGYGAYIKVDKKLKHIGSFATVEEAAKAYDMVALRLHQDFAALNFPQAL